MTQAQNRIRPVVYGLCFYFLFAATDSFEIGSFGSLVKILALVPAALLLPEVRHLELKLHPVLVVQILFWLQAMVSIFYSIHIDKSVSSVITLTLNLILVFSMGLMLQYNSQEIRLMHNAMVISGWITILLILVFADFSAENRLTLLMGNRIQNQNYLNGYFLYTFSHHCHQLLSNRKRVHLIPVCLILTIVLMTGSRGAFLAFLLTLFFQFCLVFSKSKNRFRNLFLVATLLVLLVLILDWVLTILPENVAIRFSMQYITRKGTTGRTRIWKHLLNHFSQDNMLRMLFGHGYGTSAYVNELKFIVAHNLYIDNLITLGFSGLFLQIITQGLIVGILIKNKNFSLMGAYIGMIGMCFSLSLVAYKPIWNIMMLALAEDSVCNPTTNIVSDT